VQVSRIRGQRKEHQAEKGSPEGRTGKPSPPSKSSPASRAAVVEAKSAARWREEADRSLSMAEEMKKLVLEKDGQIAALQMEIEHMLASNTRLRAELRERKEEVDALKDQASSTDRAHAESGDTARQAVLRATALSEEAASACRRADQLAAELDKAKVESERMVSDAVEPLEAELQRVRAEKQVRNESNLLVIDPVVRVQEGTSRERIFPGSFVVMQRAIVVGLDSWRQRGLDLLHVSSSDARCARRLRMLVMISSFVFDC
jgi:predicted RNase H-like nuclease (RuvC/YqgF family)